jgi:CRISPR/Cas system-associated exonuclease Cas4 (RecB family)
MRTIRASEVNSYLYCKRSWWYQKRGEPSENTAGLDAGTSYHHQHGRQVARATILRVLGWLILMAALVLTVVALTLHFLP